MGGSGFVTMLLEIGCQSPGTSNPKTPIKGTHHGKKHRKGFLYSVWPPCEGEQTNDLMVPQVHLGIPAVGFRFKWKMRGQCGPTHPHGLSAPLQGCLTGYQNCVNSLSGKQISPEAGTRLRPFSSPGEGSWGIFHYLGSHCLHRLRVKGTHSRVTLGCLHFCLDGTVRVVYFPPGNWAPAG